MALGMLELQARGLRLAKTTYEWGELPSGGEGYLYEVEYFEKGVHYNWHAYETISAANKAIGHFLAGGEIEELEK